MEKIHMKKMKEIRDIMHKDKLDDVGYTDEQIVAYKNALVHLFDDSKKEAKKWIEWLDTADYKECEKVLGIQLGNAGRSGAMTILMHIFDIEDENDTNNL